MHAIVIKWLHNEKHCNAFVHLPDSYCYMYAILSLYGRSIKDL